jgi:hypothetical protein
MRLAAQMPQAAPATPAPEPKTLSGKFWALYAQTADPCSKANLAKNIALFATCCTVIFGYGDMLAI